MIAKGPTSKLSENMRNLSTFHPGNQKEFDEFMKTNPDLTSVVKFLEGYMLIPTAPEELYDLEVLDKWAEENGYVNKSEKDEAIAEEQESFEQQKQMFVEKVNDILVRCTSQIADGEDCIEEFNEMQEEFKKFSSRAVLDELWSNY